MRHPIRSAVVAATSAFLLAAGAGTASAQGSLPFAVPFPVELPGLSLGSLGAPMAPAPAAPVPAAPAPAAPAEGVPVAVATGEGDDDEAGTGSAGAPSGLPDDLVAEAFEGRVVAAVNEARLAVGAERLVSDPALQVSAGQRAVELAAGDARTGDLTVPEGAETMNRTVLVLPEGATPQKALADMLTDTGMRERMLDGEFTHVGVGMATADNRAVHVVLDFDRR